MVRYLIKEVPMSARRAGHEGAPLEGYLSLAPQAGGNTSQFPSRALQDPAQSDAQGHLSKIRNHSIVSEAALDFRTKSYKMTSNSAGWARTLC